MSEPKAPSKAKAFWLRLLRASVQGAAGFAAWKLQNDPRWAVAAPIILGPAGKAIRLLFPGAASKVPF